MYPPRPALLPWVEFLAVSLTFGEGSAGGWIPQGHSTLHFAITRLPDCLLLLTFEFDFKAQSQN